MISPNEFARLEFVEPEGVAPEASWVVGEVEKVRAGEAVGWK